MAETIKNQKCIYINCDGASRGNPGKASIGVCIKGEDKKTVLTKYGKYIGECTNNQAEYAAVIDALDSASEFTNKNICVFSDSELLVRQLNKQYRVKDKKLKQLFLKVKDQEKFFENVTYAHILREKNQIADKLANEALDELIK